MKINYGETIKSVEAFDIRFPTSLSGDGSDAVHCDPDYSVSSYTKCDIDFTRCDVTMLKSFDQMLL